MSYFHDEEGFPPQIDAVVDEKRLDHELVNGQTGSPAVPGYRVASGQQSEPIDVVENSFNEPGSVLG